MEAGAEVEAAVAAAVGGEWRRRRRSRSATPAPAPKRALPTARRNVMTTRSKDGTEPAARNPCVPTALCLSFSTTCACHLLHLHPHGFRNVFFSTATSQ